MIAGVLQRYVTLEALTIFPDMTMKHDSPRVPYLCTSVTLHRKNSNIMVKPTFSCLVPKDLEASINNIKNAVNGLELARKAFVGNSTAYPMHIYSLGQGQGLTAGDIRSRQW